MVRVRGVVLVVFVGLASLPVFGQGQGASPRRNVIVFVADGLRHDAVNERDTPTLWSIRSQGVHFADSYSAFPTFTTANASVITTGHGLGDTGDFSNTIWTGYATFDTGNFQLQPGTPVPFVENNRILSDLDDHYGGNYLGETTIFEQARAHGYRTAAVGKLGPIGVVEAPVLAPVNGGFPPSPAGLVIDDATGTSAGLALPPQLFQAFLRIGLPPEAPQRTNGYAPSSQYNNGNAGDRTRPGTLAANVVQQQWLADATTKVVLPSLTSDPATPFLLLYWSRDPDATQHNEGDSLGVLAPGINGDTTRLAVQNADRNLRQLLDWLDAHPAIKANTDVIVTSDHGFATVSTRELDRTGRPSTSEAARHEYVDANGHVDTIVGSLPYGFLAIDLASALQMNLFDPDTHPAGGRLFKKMRLDPEAATWEHPAKGNGLIAPDVTKPDGSDAALIVAANGGSDLVYAPTGSDAIVRRVVELLLTYDYVAAVYVDATYGQLPGTLPLDAIGLVGVTTLPRPAIVVAFKSFYLNPTDLLTAIQVSDSSFQTGQGMHGGFGRDSTFNNMAAIGPDFKTGFVDAAPAGNIDLAPTIAHLMGIELPRKGTIVGRVLTEALAAQGAAPDAPVQYLRSASADGRQTVLVYRELGGVRYLHSSCLVAETTASTPEICR